MLPSSRRIPSAVAVEITGKRSVSEHTRFLSIRTIARNSDEVSRFGVVVSKKAIKTAVLRNSLRRKTYAVLRGLVPKTHTGTASLIYIKKGADTLTYDAYQNELLQLLKCARIVK